ncbi:peptide-methionine (S)-S-oxide reductase [Nonlabens sp. Hel1_33_55]|uniref:peptide-methionine (S)-S-oxide reductase MsrA n=1 Tax=Nonlabens sp. Hel1_33_55 TaxID=1336802 RepID=UPI000875AB0A|nr:peptide-methionine (S)-S-oxide reductase MsrA [Nonlabens sp. Hel1_33_55]SCY10806.1 peptide-methionine (S)-S-oxide reductase [Nonlabens sp. Hel1_33_55]
MEAILAGGCFWCTEAVFQRVKGVSEVIPGFSGGNIKNPPYREVVQGRTGHAEAIKIIFDPEIVSFKELLQVFFATHDPTTLNRQGYDIGTHYRSAIFFTNEEQEKTARELIDNLNESGSFSNPIVTEVSAASGFYKAEDYHKDYYNNNREQGYCQVIIDPKIKKLMTGFKQLAI